MTNYSVQELIDTLNNCKLSNSEREETIESIEIKLGDDVRGIDKSIAPLIEDLNKNNFTTIACCSGLISDHYNIEKLTENNITLDKIVDVQYNTDKDIIPTPWIRLEPIYHSYSESRYIVDEKYYELKRTIHESYYGVGDYDCTAAWKLYSTDRNTEFLYHIGLIKPYFWFNRNASFKEYDDILRESIKRLHINLKYFMENEKCPPGIEYNNR